MASPLSLVVIIAVGAAVVGLMVWGARRNSRMLLERDFAARAEPPGPLTRCAVRFIPDESQSYTLVGATAAGWYMAPPPDAGKGWRWTSTRFYLKTPVMIPWARLKYGPAKFPLINQFRFDVIDTPIIFFVPKGVAEALLADQPPP
ncbi:MAG TPA: hypothetical protein VHZ32_03225 [Rhizomicrobium sp.]|nr:hypothetical protein [Rhizomicrobium sp.]